MNKKRIVYITIGVIILIAFIIFLIILINNKNKNAFLMSYKSLFSNFTPVNEINDYSNLYRARYELSQAEWDEIEKKLDKYTVENRSKYTEHAAEGLPTYFLSTLEISQIESVYYIDTYVKISGSNHRFVSVIEKIPNKNGVTICFSYDLYGFYVH